MKRFLLAAVAATLLVAPADASAASLVGRPLVKAMWGPAEIAGASQFPTYRELGVTLYQTILRWDQVAPSRPADPTDPADPAYQWPAELDGIVEEAGRNGIDVLILVMGSPDWAATDPGWSRPPRRARDYGDFMTATARRYPQVHHWMIWGEPLRNMNFPGFPRDRPNRVRLARAYARVVDAAYVALKRESRRNLVIGGNTFTTDRRPVYWAPVPLYEWMRLMRLPNGRPPRMDLWGHNPFTVRVPSLRHGPGRGLGDISDTRRFLRALRRYVSRPLGRRLPVFISEYCIPEGPNDLFEIDLTRRQQADWLRRSFAIARGEPMIWGFGYFLFQDVRPPPGHGAVITCGLVDVDGRPKPAYEIFRRAKTSRR